ncbi:MAG: phosphoglycolate phosphatase [Candidatus Omnitrophota bacterium]
MDKYQLIIFDFDGTLVDTAPDIAICANRVLKQYGFEEKSLEEIKPTIRRGVNDLIRDLMFGPQGGELPAGCVEAFREDYLKNCLVKTEIYPGVVNVLKNELANIKKVIVTNKPHHLALRMVESLRLSPFFLNVLGTGLDFKLKPNPEGSMHIMRELKVNANEVLLIGDSDIDCQLAINAGVDFGWVDYGYGAKPEGSTRFVFSEASQWGILNNGNV